MSSAQVSRTPTLTSDSPPTKEKPPSSSLSSSSIVINGRIELPRLDSDNAKTEARSDSEIAIHGDIEGALYTSLSPLSKLVLLGVFRSAQFFDVFNASAVLVSLPSLGADTIADIFHPRPVFCPGFTFVGLFNIPVGASVHPVMVIVFHALQGMGAAMNVPSGIAMIRTTFPDPAGRGAAYASYALAATVGYISGFVAGGVLTRALRWLHYLCAIMAVPMAVAAWFILPVHTTPPKSERRSVDIPGVLTLTSGLILFVYAISVDAVTVTLILSVIAFIAFIVIENIVAHPALPPRTWRKRNFTPLFIYALSPYWRCLGCKLQLVSIFLNLWHDSPLIAAQLLTAMGSVLFALAGTEARYCASAFPGMVVGMLGLASAYVGCTGTVMGDTRKGEAGVVGAVMYTAYQVGSTIGVAILTSITEDVNSRQPNDPISQFRGYATSFWSTLALSGVMFIITLVFVRR